MDDDFDDDEMRVAIPSRKFRLIDLAITVLENVNSFIEDVKYLLCQHANWSNDRQRFADQVRADIEAIVSGE